jgi:hypothetical protein
MPAKSPEDICRLFQHYMAEGDIDSVLSLYDPEAVFLKQSAHIANGRHGLRQELGPACSHEGSLRLRHQTGHSGRRHRRATSVSKEHEGRSNVEEQAQHALSATRVRG